MVVWPPTRVLTKFIDLLKLPLTIEPFGVLSVTNKVHGEYRTPHPTLDCIKSEDIAVATVL